MECGAKVVWKERKYGKGSFHAFVERKLGCKKIQKDVVSLGLDGVVKGGCVEW